MPELFFNKSIAQNDYIPTQWTRLYEVTSPASVTLSVSMNITNCSLSALLHLDFPITVEMRVVDRDDRLVYYLLPPLILPEDGSAWDSAQKIVYCPGDKVIFNADRNGLNIHFTAIEGFIGAGNSIRRR
jgi:hypothetical protein